MSDSLGGIAICKTNQLGAFSTASTLANKLYFHNFFPATGDSTTKTYGMYFNASSSNSVYSNSDTVQPPANQALIIIRA